LIAALIRQREAAAPSDLVRGGQQVEEVEADVVGAEHAA
jgi:hypothetical protein